MKTNHYEQLDEKLYSEKLDNGLKVFLLPRPEMAKTYGIFTTKYGSIDQTFTPIGSDKQITVPEGIAHFLEHKLFEKEDRDVFQDFTKQGASANAFTSFTQTSYLFSATSRINENVKTLLDFVQEPYFSDKSVEKEKGIIAQEIQMYDDQPDWRSFFGTIQSLFANHPVKIDIAGTVDTIQEITKEDLYTCYQTFYHPSNMTLFVAGNFEVEEMMKLIKENQNAKSFDTMDDINRFYPEEPKEVAKKKNIIHMPVSIPKCLVGIKEHTSEFSSSEFLKAELIIQMVLDHYFSKSGEFYQDLYQEELIDDSFHFENNLEESFGFSIIGGNSSKPDLLAERIQEMLHLIKEKQLEEVEFERMKKKRIGQLLRSMNSLEFIANQFVHYHNVGIDLFDLVPTIEKLTKEDVESFIKEWIKDEYIAVCQVLPS